MDNISCLEGLIRRERDIGYGVMEGHWEEHWESGQPDGFQVENCLVLNLSELLSTYLVSLVIKFSDFGRFLEDKTFLQIYIDSCSSSSAPTPSLQDELFQSIGSLQQDGGG